MEGDLDHVADEGVIAFTLGRMPCQKRPWRSVVAVRALVERKRRIGDHDVKAPARCFQELRVAQSIAPFDVLGRDAYVMQEHIHHAERPGAAVVLLPIDSVIVAADLLGAFDEQRATATRWITDALWGCGSSSPASNSLTSVGQTRQLLPAPAANLPIRYCRRYQSRRDCLLVKDAG